jgi:hypothetical protein
MTRKAEQARMDRIRAARGLPPLTRENLFEQVAAARCYISTVRSQQTAEKLELHAFMAIFHPEYSADDVRKMEAAS